MSKWADEERRLSAESSAEPGRYVTAVTEYAREIMDTANDPRVEDCVVMSSAQVAKTTILENIAAYHMAHSPAPIMILQPTLELAEAFSKDRLAPMLRDTPCLKGKVVEAGSRKEGNTLLHKRYPGGHITIAGANSPSSLASRPVKLVLGDEIDRWPASAGTEGDPVSLVRKRTTAFWDRKHFWFSTPTVHGKSRIETLYESSDQRLFNIPCPCCGELFVLEFACLKWIEGAPLTNADGQQLRHAAEAWWECPLCNGRFDDTKRMVAVRHGRWIATQPFRGVAGFWLWEGYSPFSGARQIADAHLGALGKPEQEKAVKNTVLGATWREHGERPDWERIRSRCEPWKRGTAPTAVLFVTAGIDVQKDRIVCDWWGWGRGKQRWMLDRDVVEGDTSREEVWTRLTALIGRTFRHEHGYDMGAAKIGIDSGYAAAEVYAWARRQGPARVMVIKGNDTGVALLGQPTAAEVNKRGKYHRAGVRVWPMNASMGKSELYGQLNQPRPETGEAWPAGWIHLPDWIGDEWLKELTAEQFSFRMVKGWKKGFWEKIRERNEAIDCANIARAVASHVGIDRFNDGQWRAFEATIGRPQAPAEAPPPALAQKPVPKPEHQGLRLDRPGRDWIQTRKSWL